LPHANLRIADARGRNFLDDLFIRRRNDELIRNSDRPVLLVHSQSKKIYRRILVAVDFSEKSREAARIAMLVAPTAQIVFLHAFYVPDVGMPDEIQSRRAQACETARMELNCFIDDFGPRKQLISGVVHHGFPLPVVCNYAKRMGADLIVIGKPRVKGLLRGSAAQRFICRTSCDLLVAPVVES